MEYGGNFKQEITKLTIIFEEIYEKNEGKRNEVIWKKSVPHRNQRGPDLNWNQHYPGKSQGDRLPSTGEQGEEKEPGTHSLPSISGPTFIQNETENHEQF